MRPSVKRREHPDTRQAMALCGSCLFHFDTFSLASLKDMLKNSLVLVCWTSLALSGGPARLQVRPAFTVTSSTPHRLNDNHKHPHHIISLSPLLPISFSRSRLLRLCQTRNHPMFNKCVSQGGDGVTPRVPSKAPSVPILTSGTDVGLRMTNLGDSLMPHE
jgi:hypothetical protein